MERIHRLAIICNRAMLESTTLYGYISEFSDLIQEESRHRRVIAIAMRGHGRSEIGTQPFSFPLFVQDALAVIQHETNGRVDVLGFSIGAITSYLLTSEHPEIVRRLVAMGGTRGQRDDPAGPGRLQNLQALRC